MFVVFLMVYYANGRVAKFLVFYCGIRKGVIINHAFSDADFLLLLYGCKLPT